jgi:hypothetical protein
MELWFMEDDPAARPLLRSVEGPDELPEAATRLERAATPAAGS